MKMKSYYDNLTVYVVSECLIYVNLYPPEQGEGWDIWIERVRIRSGKKKRLKRLKRCIDRVNDLHLSQKCSQTLHKA